ncbi:MAG TPA: hypothetical protein VMO17_17990 [Terriglobia bacterium]|nr:hypothetical protein [Terriglobia bacterium]
MKISRIVSLGILIVALTALVLALLPSATARVAASAQGVKSFDEKVAALALAQQNGAAQTAHITEAELTSKLEESLIAGASSGGNVQFKTASVHLEDSGFVGIFTLGVYGKDLDLTLAGTLGAAGGRLRVQITGAKLGRLPIPPAAVSRRLEAPPGAGPSDDPLRLPDFIRDVRIENSELLLEAH